jgi:DNA-binding SARP family transcriptional activator
VGSLRIRLFGEVELSLAGDRLPELGSMRAESLLAYLIVHRQGPVARQRLAYLLWPESAEAQARTNLRQLLHRLRQTLPDADGLLEVTPRALRWRGAAWVDVVAFEEALAGGDKEAAVEAYGGDLLEGSYDEWVLTAREQFRLRYLDALGALARQAADGGDNIAAIEHAQRLLAQDPLREDVHRLLIRSYGAQGDRVRALRAYHACVDLLSSELGVEPAAETRKAYEALFVVRNRAAALSGASLVGRTAEMSRLSAAWGGAEGGRAGLALVTGEPGVGKTRLVGELRSWCARRGALTATARSYPVEGVLAYEPVVSWLRSEEVKPRLRRLDPQRLAVLSGLLPELATEVPAPLSERERRQRLFDAIAEAVAGSGRPVLLVADDLQWWDRESLQVLHYLVRSRPEAKLLVAATCRQEDLGLRHPLHELVDGLRVLDRVTEVGLERLTRAETAMLAERLTGDRLAASAAAELYGETEGNPLFVVEALHAGWRAGRPAAPLSPKVQAVIESRLDRLSEPAGELARVAATLGRAFTAPVLAAASGADVDADSFVEGLDELWRRRILTEDGTDEYDFSHDKIREVAYQGMSPAQRRARHLRAARGLARLPAATAELSVQVAAQYERADAPDDAVQWYVRAAQTSQELLANAEAIRLLRRAQTLVAGIPGDEVRRARDFEVVTALAAPLAAAEGYASPALAQVQERALELAADLGTEPAPQLLRSLALARLSTGDFAAAPRFGARLRALGDQTGDDVLVVEAEYVLGIAAFWCGEFETARRHLQTAVDRYRPEHRRTHLIHYVLDPQVVCLSRLANTWWFLGEPEQAMETRDAALALAEQVGHPPSRATALIFAALLAIDMRELDLVRTYAAALTEDLDQQVAPTQRAAEAFTGLIEVLGGRPGPGIARIRRVLDGLADGRRRRACTARSLRGRRGRPRRAGRRGACTRHGRRRGTVGGRGQATSHQVRRGTVVERR